MMIKIAKSSAYPVCAKKPDELSLVNKASITKFHNKEESIHTSLKKPLWVVRDNTWAHQLLVGQHICSNFIADAEQRYRSIIFRMFARLLRLSGFKIAALFPIYSAGSRCDQLRSIRYFFLLIIVLFFLINLIQLF